MASDSNLKVPPNDQEAEKAIISGMMQSENAVWNVIERVTGSDFYNAKHEKIFETILSLQSRSLPFDAISVLDELKKIGVKDLDSYNSLIVELSSDYVNVASVSHWAKIVKDNAFLRKVINAGQSVSQLGYSGKGEVHEILDKSQEIIFEATSIANSQNYKTFSDVLESVQKELDPKTRKDRKKTSISTGLSRLDTKTNGGFLPGQLIILAARPGMGKTALAQKFLLTALKNQTSALFFNMEMSDTEIMLRMISAHTNIELWKLINDKLNEDDLKKVSDFLNKYQESKFYIDDSPNSLMEIRSKARRLTTNLEKPLGLIVVDYIGLISGSGQKANEFAQNRQSEVSYFSRQLKMLAKDLNVPVVCLAQMNRNVEQRDKKIPMLSDLRESGSLEQDADIVLFLSESSTHSKGSQTQSNEPEIFNNQDSDFNDQADANNQATQDQNRIKDIYLIIAKQRNGTIGEIPLEFCGNTVSFQEKDFSLQSHN